MSGKTIWEGSILQQTYVFLEKRNFLENYLFKDAILKITAGAEAASFLAGSDSLRM